MRDAELDRRLAQVELASTELPAHGRRLSLDQLERLARALNVLERFTLDEVAKREQLDTIAHRERERITS